MDSGLKTSQKLIIGLPRRDQRSKSWERLTLCQVRSCSDARFWKPSFIHPGRLQWKKDVYCISFCHRLFEKTSPHYIATHKLLNEHLWLLTGTGPHDRMVFRLQKSPILKKVAISCLQETKLNKERGASSASNGVCTFANTPYWSLFYILGILPYPTTSKKMFGILLVFTWRWP